MKSPWRGGSLLYILLAFLACGAIFFAALFQFHLGEADQLSKTIDQSRIVQLGQSGIQEMLAVIKAEVNDPKTPIGNDCRKLFGVVAGGGGSAAPLSFAVDFSPPRLPQTNSLAKATLSSKGQFVGLARFVFPVKTSTTPFSLLGFLELECKSIGGHGTGHPLIVRERREIRGVDLRDLFFDKYALYLKSFCPTLNDIDRRLIIEGVRLPNAHSRVYLGSRFYPPVPEFPDGGKGSGPPPIFLDLDFLGDKALISNMSPNACGFAPKSAGAGGVSSGQLFAAHTPAVDFKVVADRYPFSDFCQVRTLTDFYIKEIVDKARPYSSDPNTVPFEIMQDFNQAGGKPAGSQLFKTIADLCKKAWKYHYGYTDYSHIRQGNSDRLTPFIADFPHFSGIQNFFIYYDQFNPFRVRGGRMPLLFGENRDIPVFVEGNVFLRFFKVAFLDEFPLLLPMRQGPKTMRFPEIPLNFAGPTDPISLSNRPVGKIHGIEETLMSRAVDEISINTFFFNESKPRPQPQQKGGTRNGGDIFPVLDPNLRTVSHFYATVGEFLADRVRSRSGQDHLFLDGISVIHGIDGAPLDLKSIRTFVGKGTIILFRGQCEIDSLTKADPQRDRLKIYLLSGSFLLGSQGKPARIEASLVATTLSPPDNSGIQPQQQGTIYFQTAEVQILGNLVVDDLNLGRGKTGASTLRITHDPELFLPLDPFRFSVGPIPTFFSVTADD